MDLLFFPIDTVKTRLQSAQGFIAAGGFRGTYQGIGSVIIGSAPGGEFYVCLYLTCSRFCLDLAAAFFTVYDAMKQHLPIPENLAPVKHVISASLGEIVRTNSLLYILHHAHVFARQLV